MARTTVPAARAALVALLRARPALVTMSVTDGLPNSPEQELVALLDADGERQPGAIGQHRHDEDYTITVLVSVLYPQEGDHTAAQERAFAIADELVAAVEDDPTLGVIAALSVQWFEAQIVSYRFEPRGPSDQGTREGALLVGVRCRSRI